ncbi:MAG TPA: hypothetical protein VMP67_03825 [Candidatus Limnocylindria bacterium]|nr:hypothetical protein [Candidatus Limnocylindria bacterium]
MPRETYTDQQWQQLVEAAPAIARGVAATSGSAGQTEQELEAFLRLLEETRADGQGLLGSLVADIHSRLSSGTLALAADDVVADGIHAARTAGALLAVEPDEQQSRAVRYWLMEVARTVAGAARSGGILGLGGQDVDRAERDTLAAISDGLGMTEGTDMQREASEEEATEPAAGSQRTTGEEPEMGPDGEPIGADNIRDGTVGGVMGGPHRQGGEGQGG